MAIVDIISHPLFTITSSLNCEVQLDHASSSLHALQLRVDHPTQWFAELGLHMELHVDFWIFLVFLEGDIQVSSEWDAPHRCDVLAPLLAWSVTA